MVNYLKMTFKKSTFALMYFFSYVFSVFIIIGAQLKASGMTECGVIGKGLILARAIPLSFLVFIFVYILFVLMIRSSESNLIESSFGSGYLYLLAFLLIFIAYIPVFLAYYPAIMVYDFHRQSQEAIMGFEYFWPYQPIIHTWLYWLFFKIGGLFGSLEIGMALYSIFQMLIMSAVLGYASIIILRLTHKISWYVVSVLLFGLFPFFSVMVVEATKDVIFSALFVLFLLIYIEKEVFRHERQWIYETVWIIVGTLLTQFRKNAIYAIIVFTIINLVCSLKKDRVRVFCSSFLLITMCQLVSMTMPQIIGTEMKEPQIEKYNVVIQSFARVLYFHSEEIDPGLRMDIEAYIPEGHWINYNPTISDGVKWGLDDWDSELPNLLKLWVKTGLQYPNEYLDSFLLTNAGYLFFDDRTWCEVLGVGVDERWGAIYTHNSTVSDVIPEGIQHISKLPRLEMLLEKIVSANSFYRIPLLNVIFRPAFYSWLILLGLYAFVILRERKKALIMLLPFLYFLTLLLGPVVCWRYIYPIALLSPVLLAVWFSNSFD